MPKSNKNNKQSRTEMAPHFPKGLPEIMHDYLHADIKFPAKKIESFTLFGVNAEDVLGSRIANLILHAGEKEVEEALRLIKKHPEMLRRTVVGKDRIGRVVEGALISIAAMAEDLNVPNMAYVSREQVLANDELGVVERLIDIAKNHLSPQEILKQLEVVTSDAAKQATQERNQRYLNAVITFAEGLKKVKLDYCNELITEFEKEIHAITSKKITMGVIFDPVILMNAGAWLAKHAEYFPYEDELDDLSKEKIRILCVTIFGTLQAQLSSRDAQFILFNTKENPPRTLENQDGSLSYFDVSSSLGKDFYLGTLDGFFGGKKEIEKIITYNKSMKVDLFAGVFYCNYKFRKMDKNANMNGIVLEQELLAKEQKEDQCSVM